MAEYNVKNYTEVGGERTVIGGEIVVTGKLILGEDELKQATNQAASTATSVADLKGDLNALITKLVAAGLMAAE